MSTLAIAPHESVHGDNVPPMAEHGVAIFLHHELHRLVCTKEQPHLYKTLDVQHLVCTTSHLYNTSFVQNLDIQQLTCTKLMCTTPHLYNTLDTQHLDIQHLKYTTP